MENEIKSPPTSHQSLLMHIPFHKLFKQSLHIQQQVTAVEKSPTANFRTLHSAVQSDVPAVPDFFCMLHLVLIHEARRY
jgi:hypothetical protein